MHVDAPPVEPPEAPRIESWVVERADLVEQVVAAVCAGRAGAVGITTALHGAGGFGKTTLATVVCADERVRRHFGQRVYMVTIGRDVTAPAAIARKVVSIIRFITGHDVAYDDPAMAGDELGRLLDQHSDRRVLLVLDDVWTAEQLDPFLRGGLSCVRLLTTRVPEVLPDGAARIQVDQMTDAQARAVLGWDLPVLPEPVVGGLLKATGRWPLLLRVINRRIAKQIATGGDPAKAAKVMFARLREHGPVAMDDPRIAVDLNNPAYRAKLVHATVLAATDLLSGDELQRLTELGIFAADEPIPILVAARLWQAAAALDETRSRELCHDLGALSLLAVDPSAGGSLSLHDVFRDYLRHDLGDERIAKLNATLIDAIQSDLPPAESLAPSAPGPSAAWWTLAEKPAGGYLLDHAITHLLAARRTPEAEALAGDIRWIEERVHQHGPTAPWGDCDRVHTPTAIARARDLGRIAHLLTPTEPAHALTTILHARLEPLPAWREQITARQREFAHPTLRNRWTPPDLPDPRLLRTLRGHRLHTIEAKGVAIAPDGTWLATGGADGVRIWDAASGKLTATFPGRAGELYAKGVAGDRTWLATGRYHDGVVQVWDAATGKQTATVTGHPGYLDTMAVAPDGTWLATGGFSTVVRIWDTATGKLTRTLTGHSVWVKAIAVAPDGTWLATGDGEGVVRIWDAATGQQTAALAADTRVTVHAIAVAADGTWLAAAHGGVGRARIWDIASGQLTAVLDGEFSGEVEALAVAPDGTWLATGDHSGVVKVWDAATGRQTAAFAGHNDAVRALAIAPDGTWLAATDGEGAVRIWDTTGGPSAAVRADRTISAGRIAIAPDGTWLATGSPGNVARIWDAVTGKLTRTLTHTGNGWVFCLAIAPDGTWLATSGHEGVVRIWNTATGEQIATLNGQVETLAASLDGTWLATIDADGAVRIWHTATGKPTLTSRTLHTGGPVRVAVIAPDGTRLATYGYDEAVRIWDTVTSEQIATFPQNSQVYAMAIASDSTWLAVASYEVVQILNARTGHTIASLTGHNSSVYGVTIAPDNTRLATAGLDGTIRIWDLVSRQALTMMRTDGRLSDCRWAPDGVGLVVTGERGLHSYEFRPGAPGGSRHRIESVLPFD